MTREEVLKQANTEISGPLSTLMRGLPKNKRILRSMEGVMPIRDGKDHIIGYITRIDLENDKWYGRIVGNDISKPTSVSMELKEK